MTGRTRRAHAALQPLRGEPAKAAHEPTPGHTGGDVGTPAHDAHAGGSSGLIELHLREIGSLHSRLARTYEDLAEEVGIVLADPARQSVHPTRLTAPRRTPHEQAQEEAR